MLTGVVIARLDEGSQRLDRPDKSSLLARIGGLVRSSQSGNGRIAGEARLVAAQALGGIHGLVGDRDQAIAVRGIVGVRGHADRAGEAHSAARTKRVGSYSRA